MGLIYKILDLFLIRKNSFFRNYERGLNVLRLEFWKYRKEKFIFGIVDWMLLSLEYGFGKMESIKIDLLFKSRIENKNWGSYSVKDYGSVNMRLLK